MHDQTHHMTTSPRKSGMNCWVCPTWSKARYMPSMWKTSVPGKLWGLVKCVNGPKQDQTVGSGRGLAAPFSAWPSQGGLRSIMTFFCLRVGCDCCSGGEVDCRLSGSEGIFCSDAELSRWFLLLVLESISSSSSESPLSSLSSFDSDKYRCPVLIMDDIRNRACGGIVFVLSFV